jgi:hypothetical protein
VGVTVVATCSPSVCGSHALCSDVQHDVQQEELEEGREGRN